MVQVFPLPEVIHRKYCIKSTNALIINSFPTLKINQLNFPQPKEKESFDNKSVKQQRPLKYKKKPTLSLLLNQSSSEMGGCLGPKQRKQEVCIETIETIHSEVTQINFNQTQNLDLYQVIKEKLSKKGLLRKLIDNLVTHRNKIYDSLNHNYEIVLQNSNISNKYAGLLIIDQIVQGIYQSLKASNKHIPFQQDTQEFTNMSSTQNNNQPFNNVQDSLQQMLGQKSRKPSKLTAAMQGNPLIREIDSRFDMIYFRLVVYLLNDVPKMYDRVLKSMNSFAFHNKRKFNCTETVWQVMNFIMNSKIEKKISMKQSVYTYRLLLQSVKENFKDYQKPSNLRTFINLWTQQTQQKNSPDQFSSTSIEEESQISPTAQEQNISKNLLSIISIYFNTNISTWNSQYLYEILIDWYDDQEFQLQKIGKFETVIFRICDRNDLRVHFFRGLFIMLLEYLCFKQGERGSRVLGGHGNAQDLKWPNSEKKQVKFNALKTLRRWVNKKHIDINETVSYNCNLLFSAYLTNFHPLDTQINTETSKEFLKLVRQHLQPNSKQILIMSIIEAIKEPQTDPKVRTLIVNLMRQLLQDSKIFSQFQQNFDFILTIDEHYSKENQLEIIQLMGFLVKALPQLYFKETCDPNSMQILAFRHKICEFLYSCFEVLVYSSADQTFKYRFCCSVVSFLRAIQIKRNISFVYAFYLELVRQISEPIQTRHLPRKNYFVLYLAYEVAHLLVDEVKVPVEFKLINQKISSITVYAQTPSSTRTIKSPMRDQINGLIDKVINQDKFSKTQSIAEQFKEKHIENELKRRNILHKDNLQTTYKILSGYFSNSCVRSKNISTKEENDQGNGFDKVGTFAAKSTLSGSFGRRDSIFNQSQNGSFYRQEDKNLKDVLGIING